MDEQKCRGAAYLHIGDALLSISRAQYLLAGADMASLDEPKRLLKEAGVRMQREIVKAYDPTVKK